LRAGLGNRKRITVWKDQLSSGPNEVPLQKLHRFLRKPRLVFLPPPAVIFVLENDEFRDRTGLL
jgi:hypothetical protein